MKVASTSNSFGWSNHTPTEAGPSPKSPQSRMSQKLKHKRAQGHNEQPRDDHAGYEHYIRH